ncbi:hypothetical protein [Deinococcus sp. UYEF24]
MPDDASKIPAAGPDGLGNDMSDRSGWTGESESGQSDTQVGHTSATWAQDGADSEGVPTQEEAGRSGTHQTGTTFGTDPLDDKPV